MGAYLDLLLRRRAYLRLWIADSISLMGDWFSVVAVSVLSLRGGDGVFALATSLVAHMLPYALLAPIAGPIADRFDRRRLLIAANVVECVLTLAMAAAAAGELVALVQGLVFARASVAALREPAAGAALPRLVQKDELVTANTLGGTTWSLTFAIGMALGGAVTELGPTVALVADAMTFGVAALLLRGLPALVPEREARDPRVPLRALGLLRTLGTDLADAARRAWTTDLRRAVFAKAPIGLAYGGGIIALNVVAHERPLVGGAAFTLGILQATRGVGTGVGPMLVRRALERGASKDLMSHVAVIAALGGASTLALVTSPVLIVVSALLWGMGSGANWVLSTSDIQAHAGDAYLGRMLALDGLLVAGAICGTSIGSALAVEAGAPLGIVVACLALSASLCWIALRLGTPRRARLTAESAKI